jgi:hypothetical protein
MKLWNHLVGLSALVAIFSTGWVSAQDQTAGVVRISDKAPSGFATQRISYSEETQTEEAQNQTETQEGHHECQAAKGGTRCKDCDNCQYCQRCPRGLLGGLFGGGVGGGGCFPGLGLFGWQPANHCYLCPITGEMKCSKGTGLFGNKCRRCVPRSNAPFGMYRMAYPLDANYRDARDGSLYAAQGYGVNVSVPLAPTVNATYNYGWGVPSSRMTYISNPVPLPPTYPPAVPAQP